MRTLLVMKSLRRILRTLGLAATALCRVNSKRAEMTWCGGQRAMRKDLENKREKGLELVVVKGGDGAARRRWASREIISEVPP